MAPISDDQLEADLKTQIQTIKKLITSPSPEDRSPLHHSWRFLQIYSTWGLRLPNTEDTLKSKLVIKEVGALDFFPAMLEGHQYIHDGCGAFQTNVFPKVIEVGRSILGYAEAAGKGHRDSIFGLITELVDKQPATVLALVQDMQVEIDTAITKSEAAETGLTAFQKTLLSAGEKLDSAGAKIETNDLTSQATIDKLAGDDKVKDSVANLQKLKAEKQREYDQYVIIATTTLTYAWIPLYGWITGPIVAGIYGHRAVTALNAVNDFQAKYMNAQAKLNTAMETQSTHKHARTSLENIKSRTAAALEHSGLVKTAWIGIKGGMSQVEANLKLMTKTSADSTKALAARATVKSYATVAGEAWDPLIKPLRDLNDNPYIPPTAFERRETPLTTYIPKLEQMVKELDAAGPVGSPERKAKALAMANSGQ